MTKRIISILAMLLFLYPCALAEEGRNVFEFCDLYIVRLNEIAKMENVDVAYEPSTSSFVYEIYDLSLPTQEEDEYHAAVAAGDVWVRVPDFSIQRFEGLLWSFVNDESDDEESTKILYQITAAISALEYDAFDDWSFEMLSQIDSEKYKSSAFEAALDITLKIIDDSIGDAAFFLNADYPDIKVHVYDGKYSYDVYVVAYTHEGNSYENVYLCASLRE